jgi:hypothetical protein
MSVVEFLVYSWAGQSLNSCGNSGSNGYTGFKIATYDTIVNLASFVGICDTARVYIATGARNSSVNTLGQPSYYTYVDIDMVNPFENSSVKSFKFDAPAAFTDSTDYNFSLAMYDIDGDSLTYDFVPA